jgi:hypothetical protein
MVFCVWFLLLNSAFSSSACISNSCSLCVCLSLSLFFSVFIYLSIYLSTIYLSIYLTIYLYLSPIPFLSPFLSLEYYSFVWLWNIIWWAFGPSITLCLTFLRHDQAIFLQWLHHFTAPPAKYKGFRLLWQMLFSTSLIVCLLYFSDSSGCSVISHCGFDLHFPED